MPSSAPDLHNVIVSALAQAQGAGLDAPAARRRAARVIRTVRPDLSPDEAWMLIEAAEAERITA